MCGLFGFLHYGRNKIKDLSYITNVLAEEAAARGTDATGIAYNLKGKLCIDKNSKSAYDMTFKHSNNVTALTGHTRHSTQGDKKFNYNNHPFYGSCSNTKFALAHNGVLINDKDLKQEYMLPKTKIETDSYVAVQLLEHKDKLDFESLKFMTENVEGSFSFSVLDSNNNLYLIKGDSPLSILHFPKEKIYIYASTEEILWKALIETDLFIDIKDNNYEQVKISDGDILRVALYKEPQFAVAHLLGTSLIVEVKRELAEVIVLIVRRYLDDGIGSAVTIVTVLFLSGQVLLVLIEIGDAELEVLSLGSVPTGRELHQDHQQQ